MICSYAEVDLVALECGLEIAARPLRDVLIGSEPLGLAAGTIDMRPPTDMPSGLSAGGAGAFCNSGVFACAETIRNVERSPAMPALRAAIGIELSSVIAVCFICRSLIRRSAAG